MLLKIDTGFNVSDMHTKCLAGRIFRNHRGKITDGFGGDLNKIDRYMSIYDW